MTILIHLIQIINTNVNVITLGGAFELDQRMIFSLTASLSSIVIILVIILSPQNESQTVRCTVTCILASRRYTQVPSLQGVISLVKNFLSLKCHS